MRSRSSSPSSHRLGLGLSDGPSLKRSICALYKASLDSLFQRCYYAGYIELLQGTMVSMRRQTPRTDAQNHGTVGDWEAESA